MSYETIKVEQDGPALVIQFDRPKQRNALSLQLVDEVMAAIASAESDPSVSAIILTGGEKGFAAGADLNEAIKVKTAQDGMTFFGQWHRFCEALEHSTKPVIAAIEGYCYTAGFELALACDLRIGARSSTYCITSARIGTVAGAGGTQRLPRIVGRANALEILFSAEPIDAEHAHRIGLINRLVEDGAALAEAKSLAALYATRAPLSLALSKRAVYRGMDLDLASSLEFETFLVTTIYGTEDKQEGISAFLEKRPAKFTGK
ncbi:enoyl-CoA hydratase/isomerase family protein [Sphingobium phenoxybenzoativorans]|uniref:enoyl-CoA hydratase/isomerase family protein n=1 Tax=Sphingobium phenoxybenzoativorans TaxID=1592790 RepID=UPI000872D4EA|nr:enoyl-CoA hydratase/isomerase family protein [Sphingobium phenoxybenzoativorans]